MSIEFSFSFYKLTKSMLWFLKVPILGQVLRKGIKKAGCFCGFFQPLLEELENFYCEIQATVDPPDRLLNFFILPTWLPTVSHSMQIEREHIWTKCCIFLWCASLLRYQRSVRPLWSELWFKENCQPWIEWGLTQGFLERPQDESEGEEIAVWCHWKAYFYHP